MKLKICGMKLNTAEVAALRPDYLGFIFWDPSSRFFDGEIPELPEGIQRVGVFVDASVDEIMEKVNKYGLHAVQLHGKESPVFCAQLRKELRTLNAQSSATHVRQGATSAASSPSLRQAGLPAGEEGLPAGAIETSLTKSNLQTIKVFSVKDSFDFSILKPYEEVCDYYLFDTKGKLPGGNGYTFDWNVLKNYPSTKPYFLSGGIGLEDAKALKEFNQRPEAEYCHAIDVNSKFEIKPGLKNIDKLNELIKK